MTLGLSLHRPEMIPLIAERMRRHEAIFLEEPPATGFEPMLTGALAVDDYLRPLDMEYPAFKQFARMDAARFRLRVSLRAQELGLKFRKYPSSYT
jgi:hypothetical protein